MKQKIAMMGHKRVPSREGGVEIVVEELSTRMAALGHQVTCFNRRGHHVSGAEFDAAPAADCLPGVTVRTVPTLDKKGLAAMTASVTAAFRCAFGKFDVVHFHAEGPCAMLWLPKLFGKRCIATIHGLDHRRAKWGALARTYIMLGEKCAAKYADEIIVLSQSVQDYFREVYQRETVLIPNGVEPGECRAAEQITREFGLTSRGYLLFLGRIVPEKGLRYLVEAYRQVQTTMPLVIAGGSSDTEEFLQELKALAGSDDRIRFVGFVQGTLLQELYSNAYLYVLPSDLEGMPLSLLEAMSFGNCCLTSDIPECAQVIEDRGVTFRQGDTEDLREKLQMLCRNREMVESYRRDAASFICGKYNWNDVTAQTLALYEKNGK